MRIEFVKSRQTGKIYVCRGNKYIDIETSKGYSSVFFDIAELKQVSEVEVV